MTRAKRRRGVVSFFILITLKLLEKPEVNPETGRRIGYTLEQVNILREHFKIVPRLKKDAPTKRLGIT